MRQSVPSKSQCICISALVDLCIEGLKRGLLGHVRKDLRGHGKIGVMSQEVKESDEYHFEILYLQSW